MVDEDEAGTAERKRDVFLRVAIADNVVMATMQFMEHPWSWSRKQLEDILGVGPRIVESGRGVLFPLRREAIDRV